MWTENPTHEEVKVVCIDPTGEVTGDEIWVDGTKDHYDDFQPIELTEEWLIKFQLPKRKVLIIGDSYYMEFSIRNDFEICCYMDKHGNCIFYGECGSEDFFIIKCNTVHAFQNIYATLNPHEKLIIK